MPIKSSIVGTSGKPVVNTIDSRWMMAYAAALGDSIACYFDTRRPEGIIAHPLFPVCFEWPALAGAFREFRNSGITADEAMRGVHATHDLVIHRPLRAGDRLTSCSTIAGVEQRNPGAYVVSRVETTDAGGAPVCTTWYGTLYRGVEVDGPSHPPTPPPRPGIATSAPSAGGERGNRKRPACAEIVLRIPGGAAHVYTECARIWNPIHTDAAVAERAGLPAIILHGTATLALSISRLVKTHADNRPERVTRIVARFAAMVLMPSEIRVRVLAVEDDADSAFVHFETLNAEGGLAIRDGVVVLRS